MTLTQRLILGLMAAVVAVWAVRHLVFTLIVWRTPALTKRSPRWDESPDRSPKVTVIIPAKDEEETLDDCLRSVRAQEYPRLEILVVDDRSSDATGAIARRHAELDPRVKVLTIADLPPGWTGKTHALDQASSAAEGEWLWFIDADTRHEPECLGIALRDALNRKVALLSLLPKLRSESFWETITQPLAGIVLMRSFPIPLVNAGRSKVAFANGQFLLVSRAAYDRAGGHAAVRDKFVEDIYLARAVKRNGDPIRVAMAGELSSTRMYTSLGGIVRGWSRILYDALGRRPGPIVGKIVEPLIFSQTGPLGLVAALILLIMGWGSREFAWSLLGLASAHLVLSHALLARMYRFCSASPGAAAWYGLAGLVMDGVLLRALGLCRSGRVTWRGTTYPPGKTA